MGNKVFTTVVLVLWLATMSWLVCAKILPKVFLGHPPQTVYPQNKPVCWKITLDGRPVGWAVSQAVPGAEQSTELHSRVILQQIPIQRMALGWMAPMVNQLNPFSDQGSLKLDVRTRTVIDSLQNLSHIEATVRINDFPSAIRMTGEVDDRVIHLHLQYGTATHDIDYPWLNQKTIGNELSPDPILLNLYVGQKWKKESYNPFGGPKGAIEMVEAEVMEETPLLIHGKHVLAHRIEYRSLNSVGVSTSNRTRSNLWVAEEGGSLLRQESHLMGITLRFDRVGNKKSERLVAELLDLNRFATLAVPNRAESPASQKQPENSAP